MAWPPLDHSPLHFSCSPAVKSKDVSLVSLFESVSHLQDYNFSLQGSISVPPSLNYNLSLRVCQFPSVSHLQASYGSVPPSLNYSLQARTRSPTRRQPSSFSCGDRGH